MTEQKEPKCPRCGSDPTKGNRPMGSQWDNQIYCANCGSVIGHWEGAIKVWHRQSEAPPSSTTMSSGMATAPGITRIAAPPEGETVPPTTVSRLCLENHHDFCALAGCLCDCHEGAVASPAMSAEQFLNVDKGAWNAYRPLELGEVPRTFALKFTEAYARHVAAVLVAEKDAQIARLWEQVRDLIHCWDVFYSRLPDGEYHGLGELRASTREARAALESTTPQEEK